MSVRRFATAAVVLSVAAIVTYSARTWLRQPPATETPSGQPPRALAPQGPASAIQAIAAAQQGYKDVPLLRVSTEILDFGSIPVSYPSTLALVLHNGGDAPVRFSDVRVDPPFKAMRSAGTVAGGESEKILVEFNPPAAGVFESRLTMAMAEAPGGAFQVVVKGRAVLTPAQAGVVIPPPPDQQVRKWEQEQAALQLQEAARRAVYDHAKEAAAREKADGKDEDTPGEAGDSAQAADAERARGAAAAVPKAFLAAFGQTQNPDTDAETPVQLPEGDIEPKPEEAPQTDGHDADKADQKAKEKEKERAPQFTIASNSSIVVSSAREPIPGQTMTAKVNGGRVQLNGRLRFPDISFAFGQTLSVEQWGNISGQLSADGSVEMNMVVRIEDTNHFVFDLPVRLTTNMTVGYSTEGRQIFTAGVPRDPQSGAIKLVGIANIPLGAGTSIDEAPVILEVLGWLQI